MVQRCYLKTVLVIVSKLLSCSEQVISLQPWLSLVFCHGGNMPLQDEDLFIHSSVKDNSQVSRVSLTGLLIVLVLAFSLGTQLLFAFTIKNILGTTGRKALELSDRAYSCPLYLKVLRQEKRIEEGSSTYSEIGASIHLVYFYFIFQGEQRWFI